MTRYYFTAVVFLALISSAFSQTFNITGKVSDADNSSPLVAATVVLMDKYRDVKYHDVTTQKGNFEITGVQSGTYLLKITYIGYDSLEKKIEVNRDLRLGNLQLKTSTISTNDVEVTAKAPVGEQKEDTTILNANRFKTQPDASAEDLIKKMPGIQVDGSSVKAHGEDVKKVLVDGKQFFGDDPSLAIKNLPAEVIDRVQIYDKMSDQAEFSGFDDGQAQKTLNFITKKSLMHGQFGKASLGYGYEDKYIGSLNYNYFQGPTRFSLLGLTNNINQQNFSFMDILDMFGSNNQRGQQFRAIGQRIFGGMRMTMQSSDQKLFTPGPGGPGGGMGGFFMSQLDGVSTTHAIGTNYNDNWGEHVEVNGSYFVNYSINNNNQNLDRNYVLQSDSLQSYLQDSQSKNKNLNHRFNFRFNWQIDTSNSLIITPNMSAQISQAYNDINSQSLMNTSLPANLTNSGYNSDFSGLNFNNDILFRHRFIPGRTISFDLNTSYNDKYGESNQQNYTFYNAQNDTINQISNAPVKGYGVSGNLVYTEPINPANQIQANYSLSYNSNNTDKRTYILNYLGTNAEYFDSLLSNTYNNNYLTHKAGLGWRYKEKEFNVTAMLYYQNALLNSDQQFPQSASLNQSFQNILPALRMNYKFNQTSNIFVNYRAVTNMPTITQLQNVIDNSNPMQLSEGNPELKQQYSNNLMFRFANFSSDFSNIFNAFVNLNYTSDYIGNSTLVNSDTVPMKIASVSLAPGGQISKPVNLSGMWNASGFLSYGFPLSFIKSNFNLNAGLIYSRIPSIINNQTNYASSVISNFILVLSSNISSNLDFTVSTRANLTNTTNSIRSAQDNKYNTYITAANLRWIFWDGFFIEGDYRNQIYSGLVQNNSNYNLLNMGIGKKFLKNDAAEIKLSVFDMLKQNKSTSTNVTDYYIEYAQNSVLSQYVLLTFTYNLRKFAMF